MYPVNKDSPHLRSMRQPSEMSHYGPSHSHAHRSRSSSRSTGSSASSGGSHILTMGYQRSSSSSSTTSSGKNLVRPSGRGHDRGHAHRETRYVSYPKGTGLSSSSPSPSPEPHKKAPPKFFIGPPSATQSITGYHSPLRSSPSPDAPSSPDLPHIQQPHLLHPNYNLSPLHPQHLLTPPNQNSKISSIYDAYWQIPRASLWCSHRDAGSEEQKCSKCDLKDDVSSTCSSMNPPPTFTAMDNYRPIRKRRNRCSCGAIFVATTVLSTIVLALIVAFIIYVETVLKQTQYIPDPM